MIDLNELLETISDCEDTLLVFADERFHLTAMSDSCLDLECATAVLESSKPAYAIKELRGVGFPAITFRIDHKIFKDKLINIVIDKMTSVGGYNSGTEGQEQGIEAR